MPTANVCHPGRGRAAQVGKPEALRMGSCIAHRGINRSRVALITAVAVSNAHTPSRTRGDLDPCRAHLVSMARDVATRCTAHMSSKKIVGSGILASA